MVETIERPDIPEGWEVQEGGREEPVSDHHPDLTVVEGGISKQEGDQKREEEEEKKWRAGGVPQSKETIEAAENAARRRRERWQKSESGEEKTDQENKTG